MTALPTWPIAGLSLVLGFAVADVTGVRPLGGIVLLAAAVWLGMRWRAQAGAGRAAALLVLYATAFVLSHVIADALGTWGAVATVAAAVAAAAWSLADRRRPSIRRDLPRAQVER